ncbi:unnamed protein product, partial [Meganyctiphanes norvegica]
MKNLTRFFSKIIERAVFVQTYKKHLTQLITKYYAKTRGNGHNDSALIVSGSDPRAIASLLSKELEKKLNKVESFEVKCGNETIKHVKSVKYLGLQIDNDLSGKNELNFNQIKGQYGCRVVSLDFSMKNWTHSFRGHRKHFLSNGIGSKNNAVVSFDPKGNKIFSHMLTLNSLLRILDAQKSTIDYLKMDIENAEWEVLEQVLLNSPWVLRRVKQLALEVHLEDVQELSHKPEVALDKVERILFVLNGLKKLGFHVAKWWRNDWSNIELHIGDDVLYIYLEVLMVKWNTQ